jgi:hypothetical protein
MHQREMRMRVTVMSYAQIGCLTSAARCSVGDDEQHLFSGDTTGGGRGEDITDPKVRPLQCNVAVTRTVSDDG